MYSAYICTNQREDQMTEDPAQVTGTVWKPWTLQREETGLHIGVSAVLEANSGGMELGLQSPKVKS